MDIDGLVSTLLGLFGVYCAIQWIGHPRLSSKLCQGWDSTCTIGKNITLPVNACYIARCWNAGLSSTQHPLVLHTAASSAWLAMRKAHMQGLFIAGASLWQPGAIVCLLMKGHIKKGVLIW